MKNILLIITIACLCSSSMAQDTGVKKEGVFKDIKKIVMNSDFCTLKIIGNEDNDVSFSGLLTSNENQEVYDFDITQTEDVLKINVVKPEKWVSHWGEITLKLPKGVSVDVESQSGKIDAEGLMEVNLNVITKSGNIVLTSLQGNSSVTTAVGNLTVNNYTGDLKTTSKTGGVNIAMLKGNGEIECSEGLIIVSDVEGNLNIDGGIGNQEVENVKGDIKLKSTSGHIKLSIIKGNIVCKSFSGNLKLFNTDGVYDIDTSKGNIVGTRVAFAASSTLVTTEGNVKIQMDTKENLAFILKSDGAFLRAMATSKKKSLKIGKGEIVITGTSTTGSQAYY